jgi:hypothetical protein
LLRSEDVRFAKLVATFGSDKILDLVERGDGVGLSDGDVELGEGDSRHFDFSCFVGTLTL